MQFLQIKCNSSNREVRFDRVRKSPPVGTLAIGKPGAINAALFAIAILANSRPELRKKLHEFRAQQEKQIREITLE